MVFPWSEVSRQQSRVMGFKLLARAGKGFLNAPVRPSNNVLPPPAICLLAVFILSGCGTLKPEISQSETPAHPYAAPTDAHPSNIQIVYETYYKVWNAPNSIPRDARTVRVQIVVADDGRVKSSRITAPSGNAALDQSVQNALAEVHRINGFSESSQWDQSTFNIGFSVEKKTKI
jgi:TonB family protein